MSGPADEAGPVTLANGFELVRLLELVCEKCTRAGAWQWQVILLTVELPEPYLIGTDGARLWMKRAGTSEYLHGFTSSEFLAQHYASAPVVKPAAAIWRFEVNSSAPYAERFTEVTRPQQRARVHAAVLAAAADLDRFRAAQRAVVARRPDAPAWQTCAMCSPLEEAAFGAKRPSDEYTEVPVRQWYLPVLGAPTFRANVDRGWCVQQCPACRTYYLSESDYEYFVNGATEDSSSFTRLTDAEAAPWLAKVEAKVRAAAAAPPPR